MSKKSEALNMNFSTAQNKLRKSLLWDYVVKCGDNICYQCNNKIDNIAELSIEHKEPWLNSDNPSQLFFDLNNIAFSHLSCNIRAANSGAPVKYQNDFERIQANKKSKEVWSKKVCPITGLTNRQLQYRRTGK